MTFNINRRRLIQVASSAATVGALAPLVGFAQPKPTNELRVIVGGGDFGKAFIEAYVKPFEAETGVKVTPITQNITDNHIATMVSTNSVSVDLCFALSVDMLAAKGYLEKIDYSIYKKEELDGILPQTKHDYAVAPYMIAQVLVLNTQKFPAGKPRPQNWAEFWDAQKFPGVRTLSSGAFFGAFEEALLADGVPVDKLYPMDINRIYASLDKVKPHVRKWWNNGSEVLQIMRDGAADMGQCLDGRANFLIDQGAPIEIVRNQSKLYWDSSVIPKGAANAVNAQRFLEFQTRGERQAALAKLFPQAPTNRNAFKHLPDAVARKLCTHPDYAKTSYVQDLKWLQEQGADGLTNLQRIRQRWNQWVVA